MILTTSFCGINQKILTKKCYPKFNLIPILRLQVMHNSQGGGTDLERGYGDVRPWRPPFHASHFKLVRKGPISSKRAYKSVHKPPFWEKMENFAYSIFAKISALKPPNLKISVHKPIPSETRVSSQAPHFGNPGRTPLPEKKLSWLCAFAFNAP